MAVGLGNTLLVIKLGEKLPVIVKLPLRTWVCVPPEAPKVIKPAVEIVKKSLDPKTLFWVIENLLLLDWSNPNAHWIPPLTVVLKNGFPAEVPWTHVSIHDALEVVLLWFLRTKLFSLPEFDDLISTRLPR